MWSIVNKPLERNQYQNLLFQTLQKLGSSLKKYKDIHI